MRAYIILNEDNTFYTQRFVEGFQPEGAIEYTYTGNFVKPKFDISKSEVYEGATPQEVEDYQDQFFAEEVSRRQLRLQWQLDGRELSEIDNYIEAMPETTEPEYISKIIVKNAWSESITFLRKDPLMQGIGIELLGSKQALNDFFQRASNL